MTTVLILAAGEQARWEGDTPKQLLEVHGEPLISRIQRQVRMRRHAAFIITHHPQITVLAERAINPRRRRWVAETLRSTEYMWTKRVIVLLGDVLYSKALMDEIIAYNGDLCFWGNLQEIYALSFNDEMVTQLFTAIDKAVHHAEYSGGPGKLRKVFQALVGFDFDDNNIKHRFFETIYLYDYTQDFDTQEEWDNFVKEKMDAGLIDDL